MSVFTLLVQSPSAQSERRFVCDITVASLKGKLESITGIESTQMSLQLLSPHTKQILHSLDEDHKRLDTYQHMQDYAILNVIPTGNAARQKRDIYNDTSLVEKFEITKEEYEKRNDTVKAFKERMKLGRFDPEAVAEKTRKEDEFIQKTIQDACYIKVGQRCQVMFEAQPKRGEIKFVGDTQFKPGVWVGIHYDEPMGKNNGTVEGKKYFNCPPNYGAFVRPDKVEVGDFPELDLMSDDDM